MIKDGKTYLDYQINTLRVDKKEDIGGEIWIKNPELLKDINDKFNTKFILETFCFTTYEKIMDIWNYMHEYKDIMGTFGFRDIG